MNGLFVNYFPTVASVFVLLIHILGFIITSYLPNYLEVIFWLLAGGIDSILILKLGSITSFFHKAMYIDTLTQLNNRSFFNLSISDVMEKMKKKKSQVSLLMIDLDNFKSINDTYGHIAGDEVLKQLSDILRRNTRGSDIATRWGGDEFVIAFPGVCGKDAFNIGDRIRRVIHSHEFFYNGTIIKATVSIGVTSTENRVDVKSFIDLADKALYKAKTIKNTVELLDA